MYNPYQGNYQGGYQGNYQQNGGFQGQFGYQMPQQQQQQPQYVQQQQTGFYQNQNQVQQQPQQPGLFQGQQTGFQPQQTGFQPQQTGFQPQQTGFSSFQQQPQLNPQATGFQQPLTAQKTGFSAALSTVTENKELKIPSIRLSFITAEEQTKFEHLFRTAVAKGENSISGDGARDILLRSGLQPVTLAEIWTLSDTNKSGALLFPEFALALHLCNLSLKGEPLPGVLPQKWSNEVQSFVDAINFAVPEDPSKIMANTPFSTFAPPKPTQNDWLDSQNFSGGTAAPPPMTSFTAQPTGGFNSLTAQRTGGGSLIPLQPQQTAGLIPAQQLQSRRTGPLQPQGTGFQQPQLTAQRTGPTANFQPQQTGLQPQGTGFNGQPLQAQGTGFNGAQGLQPQGTGFNGNQGLQPQGTGFNGVQGLQQQRTGGFQPQQTGAFQPQQTGGLLQSQPTGKPGQWGFVHTPTGGIPGLNAMEQHFLPNAQMNTANLQNAMGGSLKSNVGWAITKQEKSIYDGIFSAWDPDRKGFIQGDTAIGIFNKSGLSRPDLESIWNLCDSSNRGKLNKDEFAVAMHLVYRRLNGLEIPLRLPPELIPPSAKYLQDSYDSLKNSLKGGNKGKPQAAKPPTSASRFRNDDEDMGYVSGSRHRSRRPTEDKPSSVQSSKSNDLTVADLKKLIREKQILLDAVNSEDQHASISNRRNDDYNSRIIDGLKTQIKDTEEKLGKLVLGGSQQEKKQLLEKLNHFTKDKVPVLVQRIHKVNQDLAQAKIAVAKAKLKKQYPDWTPGADDSDIVGTGPNGEITEIDRKKHKSKILLRQRMAALTGKTYSSGTNTDADNSLKQASESAEKQRTDESSMIKDIESSIKDLEDGAAVHLQVSVKDESGVEKWENGVGVSQAVKQFIGELKQLNQQYQKPESRSVNNQYNQGASVGSVSQSSQPASNSTPSAPKHQTAAEKQAYIKAQAQKRMDERLAKLGLSRNKGRQTNTESSPKEIASPKAETPAAAPEPVAPPKEEVKKPEPQQPPVAPKASEPERKTEESSDDDDEEYAALLKQKKEMEAKKLKKKQEKEARLAKLKKEMASMEESSDEEVPATSTKVFKPTSSKSAEPAQPSVEEQTPAKSVVEVQQPEEKKSEEKSEEAAQSSNGPHKSNPFARFDTNSAAKSPTQGAAPSAQNTNPFFKPTSTQTPVDQKRMEAQRASQRGLGSDDWSDEEANSTDDDEPNRAGAAKLASLLFGGMPQPISRNPTGNLASQQAKAIQSSEQAKPTAEPTQQAAITPPVPESVPAPPSQAPPAQEAPAVPEAPPVAPPIPQTLPPSNLSFQGISPAANNDDEDEPSGFDTDSTDEFASPMEGPKDLGTADVPPIPSEAPPLPQQAPPIPTEVPPLPQQAPPPPSSIPPPPSGVPPPPSGGPPPPPPSFLSGLSSDGGASGSNGAPAGGLPNLGALLGQIQTGKSLKKVDESQKKISDGSTVGRVL